VSVADALQHEATNLYHDPGHEIEAVKILPGEYYVTNKDMLIVNRPRLVCRSVHTRSAVQRGRNESLHAA
jgi:hypothetical protein